ncbi:CAP domain-containing protein [bacterium]|nr:CAP domain-containing protein [bacterium]
MKKIIALGCAFLAAALIVLFSSASYRATPETQIKKEAYPFRKKLLDLHNKERIGWGYKPLEMDERLCNYAQNHAEKMAKEESLEHSRMSDLQKVNESSYVGENIAWGQDTEADVVSAWMWSPRHRWNILGSNYGKAGFGAAKDSDGRYYWCVVFSD